MIPQIRNREDYERAMAALQRLMKEDPPAESEGAKTLRALGEAIERYEQIHFPIGGQTGPCEYHVNPFAMGDEDGRCGKPGGKLVRFRRKSDGELGADYRCPEHAELTNDEWEIIPPGPQYPQGQLTEDDQGELLIRIGIKRGAIAMEFGKPVAWFGFGPAEARGIAARLTALADELDARNEVEQPEEPA